MIAKNLKIGTVNLAVPIILAPMAGVTNAPFRRLCRDFALAAVQDVSEAKPAEAKTSGIDPAGNEGSLASAKEAEGPAKEAEASEKEALACGTSIDAVKAIMTKAGLDGHPGAYVTEMITSRALVERTDDTMRMITPDETETLRSIQLYGVDPTTMGAATRILVGEGWARHVDLNFGCPVPKVTKKGGGAALPWKTGLYRDIVAAVVAAARAEDPDVPVTVKIRTGIDDDHLTFQEAGRIAAGEGAAAVTLHGRTLAQHYGGRAHWDQIAELVDLLDIPVLGNGDVFEAEDAARLVAETGCAGVVVGRGCQGRPWLFYDLAAHFLGSDLRYRPTLAQVAAVIERHADLMEEHFARHGGTDRALREMRKHIGWYLRGFAVGGPARGKLNLVSTREELTSRLSELDLTQTYPEAATGPRGRAGNPKNPHLPDGWLESHDLTEEWKKRLEQAELADSGG